MSYILGIDQGGSKTQAVITDETGQILGTGRSFGACHSVQGMQRAMDAVREAVDQAAEQSGIRLEEIAAAAGGMTGADPQNLF